VDPQRLREVEIMSEQIDDVNNKMSRYKQADIVEHLASQFVLGSLSYRVQKRVLSLCKNNTLLEQRIDFWQEKLVVLDLNTSELQPEESTWAAIADAVNIPNKKAQPEKIDNSFYSLLSTWFSIPIYRLATGFSVVCLMLISMIFVNPLSSKVDQLSYVAVLTAQDGNAHLVATTYGESKKLVVNIVNAPKIAKGESLELWVISKTDAQARSLGVIPQNKDLIEQQLTQAQWRLIKDSESLIVTIEEAGGSPIGEPSEFIVSQGLCVRLKEWNENA